MFTNDATRKLVKDEIFNHPDWLALDKGTLEKQDAIERGAARTNLPEEQIASLFDQLPHSLTPIQGTIDLLHAISGSDNRFYVLSNMHHAAIDHLEATYSIWDLFDGAVFSCRIKKIKPDAEIYEHLLETFDLVATDTVFIDDMAVNLEAASQFGIKTIQFESPFQCRQALVELGCI
ncbi:MAG: HAD family phosphatase [Pseudomonadales bacterium]